MCISLDFYFSFQISAIKILSINSLCFKILFLPEVFFCKGRWHFQNLCWGKSNLKFIAKSNCPLKLESKWTSFIILMLYSYIQLCSGFTSGSVLRYKLLMDLRTIWGSGIKTKLPHAWQAPYLLFYWTDQGEFRRGLTAAYWVHSIHIIYIFLAKFTNSNPCQIFT